VSLIAGIAPGIKLEPDVAPDGVAMSLQKTLATLLAQVGLERRAKPVTDIRRQLGMD
jgi:hypothetical protein